ncbi:hypothetical protein MWU59_10445 [Flavobacteriaceae bacterium F08102]|nr:hypothetical protein [Flavobacteriaceae bacterium F08102]
MKNLFLILICLILSSSCKRIIVGSYSQEAIDPYLKVFEKGDKTIIYIPSMHIGAPEFYASIKKNIDSLRSAGFTIGYEGVASPTGDTPEQIDTLKRKFRKIIRFHLTNSYKDTANHSISKQIKKRKGIAQSRKNTGLNYDQDINMDLSANEMIKRYEEENGKIHLTDCDFSTPLNARYKCAKDKSISKFKFIRNLRDDHLCNLLINSTEKKIAVLFGAGHWHSVYPNLTKAGYKLVKGSFRQYGKDNTSR